MPASDASATVDSDDNNEDDEDIVGTIAGDDTVLVITSRVDAGQLVADRLLALVGFLLVIVWAGLFITS